MFNKIKCAVIGAGKMGKNHLRVYSELSEVNLVAIADINQTAGKELSADYKTKYYSDYEEMIDKEKPDAVSICVPTAFHHAVGKKCIAKGVNLLLEKPIAIDLKEAKELIELAKLKKITFMVGHIERYNPAVTKLKSIIKSGKLGKITSIIARRVGGFPFQIRDANIMVDLAIHDIDIVNYLLDETPQEIYVNKKRVFLKKREDSVEFFFKYKTASAYIQANWFTPVKIRKLNITGTKGYVELDYINQDIEFFKSNYDIFKDPADKFSDYILRFSQPDKINIPVKKKEPLKEELIFFINSIKKNLIVDSQFALDSLRIALS